MRTAPPLNAPYFRSDGQARVLAGVLLADQDELTIQDVARRAGVPYSTAHREVERQLEAGLFVERQAGNYRLIRPNPDSPLLNPVRELVLITAGPVPLLAAALGAIPGIDRAFIFGSFAARARGVPGPAPHDIDVMVIGTPDPMAVYEAAGDISDHVGRPVNPTIMTPEEAADDSSGFLADVRNRPAVPIV